MIYPTLRTSLKSFNIIIILGIVNLSADKVITLGANPDRNAYRDHNDSSLLEHHSYKRETQEETNLKHPDKPGSDDVFSISAPRVHSVRDTYAKSSPQRSGANGKRSTETPQTFMSSKMVLSALGIDDVPTNLTNKLNSGAIFVRSLRPKISVNDKGGLRLNTHDNTFDLLNCKNGEIQSSGTREHLSSSLQMAISNSDTIVSCPSQPLPSIMGEMEFNFGPTSPTIRFLDAKAPLVSAHLRVFRNYTLSIDQKDPFKLHSWLYLKSRALPMGDELTIEANTHGWITMDVSSHLSEWVQNREDGESKVKLGLGLTTTPFISNYGFKSPHELPSQYQPFLVINLLTVDIPSKQPNVEPKFDVQFMISKLEEIEARSKPREKRSAVKKTVNRSGEKVRRNPAEPKKRSKNQYQQQMYCSKRNWYVSFKDFNWNNWIIAPEGFNANYCSGECPFPIHPNLQTTNHAIMQNLASLMDKSMPRPCCAPTKLEPITVLFYDNYSNVVLKEYRNMIVSECGCL